MDYLYSVAKISFTTRQYIKSKIFIVTTYYTVFFPCFLKNIYLSKTKQIIIQQQDKEIRTGKTSLQEHNRLTNAMD